MKTLLYALIIRHWHRKVTAVVAAIIIWMLVNHSITITRTIPNIPVRVMNIPDDMTIEGLLPGGLLSRRLTLSVTGRKTILQSVTPKDLEVVTDAAGKGDRWTFTVNKRDLVSTNPDVDVGEAVSSLAPEEVTIQLQKLIKEKIPIAISHPVGEPPEGYRFLDVWPQRLQQTVQGPERLVRELKAKGLRLTFNLDEVSKEELDRLYQRARERGLDEVRFLVPASWKRVTIPFPRPHEIEINDPEAAFLRLDFLKQELLPLGAALPISLFFPLRYSATLNPDTYSLETNGMLTTRNGITVLGRPVFVRNVSRQFLDVVRDSMEVTISAVPRSVQRELPWSLQFIDPRALEQAYVNSSLQTSAEGESASPKLDESYLRSRFRQYMRELELYSAPDQPLEIDAELEAQTIQVRIVEGQEQAAE